MHKTSILQSISRDDTEVIPFGSSYIMVFAEDTLPLSERTLQVIRIESADEAILFRKFIGKDCNLHASKAFIEKHPDLEGLADELSSINHITDIPFDVDTAAKLMQKIPLDLKNLLGGPLAVRDGDLLPAKIEKGMVHKAFRNNILISEPHTLGRLHHFNMFHQSGELTDHISSHVEGMLIIEATRQASTATAHLQGMPLDGKIALLSYTTNFYNYVDRSAPIIIRTFTSFTGAPNDNDKDAPIYIQVIQWGKVCADAKPMGFAYMKRTSYEKTTKLAEKIAIRNKQLFELKISKI